MFSTDALFMRSIRCGVCFLNICVSFISIDCTVIYKNRFTLQFAKKKKTQKIEKLPPILNKLTCSTIII